MIEKHTHGICVCVARDAMQMNFLQKLAAILFHACEPRASSVSKHEEGLGTSLFSVFFFFSTGRKFFYINKVVFQTT